MGLRGRPRPSATENSQSLELTIYSGTQGVSRIADGLAEPDGRRPLIAGAPAVEGSTRDVEVSRELSSESSMRGRVYEGLGAVTDRLMTSLCAAARKKRDTWHA
jgi:hypothetical protein